jgi:hypothetical protein
MIAHAAKAKDFREVQTAEAFYQRSEVVFFSVSQRETWQGGAAHDMIHSCLTGN